MYIYIYVYGYGYGLDALHRVEGGAAGTATYQHELLQREQRPSPTCVLYGLRRSQREGDVKWDQLPGAYTVG